MITMVGGLAVGATAADPQTTSTPSDIVDSGTSGGANSNPSVTTALKKNNGAQKAYDFFASPKVENYHIDRVGGISSRPWTQTVGWSSGTAFADPSYYQPHFNLFWVGNTPE